MIISLQKSRKKAVCHDYKHHDQILGVSSSYFFVVDTQKRLHARTPKSIIELREKKKGEIMAGLLICYVTNTHVHLL